MGGAVSQYSPVGSHQRLLYQNELDLFLPDQSILLLSCDVSICDCNRAVTLYGFLAVPPYFLYKTRIVVLNI